MQTPNSFRSSEAGFTLIELLIVLVLLAELGFLVSSYTLSGTWLFAKNTSLNTSHSSVRAELDRLADELQRSQNVPTLIDTTGTATANASAEGLQYDRLVGNPYYLVHPGGGYAAATTTITVIRSIDPLAGPPFPAAGDVLLVEQPTGNPVRAQISTATSTNIDGANKRETINLTLVAPFGIALDWNASQPKTSQLVRRQAFIVMPSAGRNELRFYQRFEPLPALNDPANYALITNQVSTFPGDATPFTLDNSTGNLIVKASLRVRSEDYVNSLANKQANSFNTFVRIDATLPSRLIPRAQTQ